MAYVGTPIDTTNQFQSLQGKRFNGDGSTTDFTLDIAPSSTLDIEVFVENVRQDPNSAYTLSGTTLSFTGAPPSGTNNIYVVHQAKAVGTIDVPAGGVAADSLATSVLTGQTDIGGAIADADLFLVDDGAGGTLRKTAASRIKTYIGDNTPAFFGTKASAQSVSRATYTKVTGFTNNEIDSDSAFDGTTFTVPTGEGGKYMIFFHMWADYATSAGSDGEYSIASIYVNGSAIERSFFELPGTTNVTQHHVNVSAMRTLSAGDTVEAYAYLKDENGGAADVQATFCSFYGYKLLGV